MKKLFLLFALLMSVTVGRTQTYSQYWSEVEDAERKDLPRSALNAVNAIRRKATEEGNSVQLLKALLAGRLYGGMVSPDSAEVYKRLIQNGLENERDSVNLSLWHSALGQLFTVSHEDDSARLHLLASLQPAKRLAITPINDYLPLLKAGTEAMAHTNNLLGVNYRAYLDSYFCQTDEAVGLLGQMADIYDQADNRPAAMTCRLERIRRLNNERHIETLLEKDTLFTALTDIIAQYNDLTQTIAAYEMLKEFANGRDDTSTLRRSNDSLLIALTKKGIKRYEGREANELRNFLTNLQAPTARLGTVAPLYLPGETARLTLTARNAERLTLRIVRIADSAAEFFRMERPNAERLAARSKEIFLSRRLSLAKRPAYQWETDSVCFKMPDRPGVYALQLWMDGKAADTEIFKISNVRPLIFSSAPGKNRITVLHSKSGLPIAKAKVTAYDRNQRRQAKVYHTDKDGTLYINLKEQTNEERLIYFIETAVDRGSDGFTLPNIRLYNKTESAEISHIDLFTDRAVYRPGQDVAFSITAYNNQGDNFHIISGLEGRVRLYDVNYRAIDSLLVKTDTLGTANGRFRLPEAVLSGNWYLEIQAGALHQRKNLRVEEYKRPTFSAETRPVLIAYSLGDTVSVEGEARTYSGIPIVGAKVCYETTRYTWSANASNNQKESGFTITDKEGRFALPVHLFVAPSDGNKRFAQFSYTVRYTITAENGETVEGSTVLRAATAPARLETNISSTICKERLRPWTIRQLNASDRETGALVDYTISRDGENVLHGTVSTGKAFLIEGLETMSSGCYTLSLKSQTPSVPRDTISFILMSETDTRPADRREPFYSYVRESEQGDSVFALVGTPEKEALLFYDLIVRDSILESHRILLSDTLIHFQLNYRPEYGDGARAYVSLVRNGRLYQSEWNVKRPEPCKKLNLRWSSFRNLLIPGMHEEWTLTITNPDGTPASANLLALLYDNSLDAFSRHRAAFSNINFQRWLPYTNIDWREYRPEWYGRTLFAYGKVNLLPTVHREAARWDGTLFRNLTLRNHAFGVRFSASGVNMVQNERKMKEKAVVLNDVAEECAQELVALPEAAAATKENGSNATKFTPRTNFSETAFFMPRLRTDEKGLVTLAFDLPESITSWRFLALAHDRAMNHGEMDTIVTARKDFMVETALPRFVRKGDVCEIPVKITNLCEHSVTAKVNLSLSETINGAKDLFEEARTLTLSACESQTISYIYKVETETPAILCRAVGQSGTFSDGEERLLPILNNEVQVVHTLPFSLNEIGTTTLEIDTLFPKEALNRALTVEVSSNAAWVAVTALPALSGTERSLSATEWCERYYALALGEEIARQRPEIKTLAEQNDDEAERLSSIKLEAFTELTPWLKEAQTESSRGRALRALFDPLTAAARRKTAFERLAALQRADGSWSWYPGMPSNDQITLEIATLLARVQKLAAQKEVDRLFLPALNYLKSRIKTDVERMKQTEKRNKTTLPPTEQQLRYLYLRTMLGLRPDDDARYLIGRIKTVKNAVSLYDKALSAIILAHSGEENEARETIQSLMEYTVFNNETGRYFDSPRALSTQSSYRIPTQCATIEALEYFGRKQEAKDLRLWLLQSKRTQMWETSRATADAVYTLLTAGTEKEKEISLTTERPIYYTLYKGRKPVALNASGDTQTPTTAAYFKQTYRESPATEADHITLHKANKGISWGSVYASFTIPSKFVRTEGQGLQLTTTLEAYLSGKWQPITPETTAEKGTRLRQVLTLTADRDLDFVSVQLSRAACLQPAAPLSGYRYENGLSFYRSLTDSRTDFHIERVAKGTHRLTEEAFVDRTGVYHCGTAKVSCLYAPEFAATAAESVITVK